MRRLILCGVFINACGSAPVTECPMLEQTGACDGNVAKWCEGANTTATTLDCTTVGGVCATDPSLGAWCAVPMSTPCTLTGNDRSGYLYCGDATGVSAALACDLDTGCTASTATCTPGETVPTCNGDSLVTDCTPWGQSVQRLCTSAMIGATGCTDGACSGVPAGGKCDPLAQCASGFVCDSASNTCIFQTASHPPVATVVSGGGTVLTHPKVMVISWASDAVQAGVANDFVTALAASPYWAMTTSEYGVGPLTILPPVSLTSPVITLDSQAVALIEANTQGATPAWGVYQSQTYYDFVIPAGTSFDDGTNSKCCQDYDGYHSEAQIGNRLVPYTITCTCPGFDDSGSIHLSNAQQLTVVMSHELVEGCADPYIFSTPAFSAADDAHAAWSIATEGEVADMCEDLPDYPVTMAGSTYTVQRTWSNAASLAGNDPCVPSQALFAGTEPVLNDTARVTFEGPVTTNVIKIAIGSSGVVDLPLYSNMPTTPWRVSVQDYSQDYEGGPKRLAMTLDKSRGNNGDVLHLTITPASFDSSIGGAIFIVESDFQGGSSLAMGIVAKP